MKGAEGPSGRRSVRETVRARAGRPVVVSRTWQVMGSLVGVVVVLVEEGGAMVGAVVSGSRGERVVLVVFVEGGKARGSMLVVVGGGAFVLGGEE